MASGSKQREAGDSHRVPPVSRLQDRELQEMKDEGCCLSMHQPWASLLVEGIKKYHHPKRALEQIHLFS